MDSVLYAGLQKYFYLNFEVLEKFHSLKPDEILSLKLKDFLNIGLKEKDAEFIISKKVIEIGEEELKRSQKEKISIIPFSSPSFPSLLREIQYCPLAIWIRGKKEVLSRPSVSIVGARNCSPYGRVVAESLSSELSKRGLVIVSGLARGIDTFTHLSSIEKGETIAVLGSGLDRIYPRENRKIATKIEERGAILTEFPLGTNALPFHFPIRNRIISGLSFITVVVEASEKSGALITAKWALEQGRDVLSVPGPVTSPLSVGTNTLIKQGAKPVLSWKDVWEEIPDYVKNLMQEKVEEQEPELSREEEKILSLIPLDSEVTIDELSLSSGIPVYELFQIIFQLELKDLIRENPGKSYQRKIR